MMALYAVAAYLIGHISGSLILGKLLYHEDIRQKGSGNAGTTNALRVYGWRFGLMTFAIDLLKGLVVAMIAQKLGGWAVFWLPFFAVLGHNYPILFQFKGGKGIATSFGALLILAPKVALILVIVFAVLVAWTRYISLGSVSGGLITTIAGGYTFFTTANRPLSLLLIALGLLSLWRHRGNIVRLIKGNERKLGERAS